MRRRMLKPAAVMFLLIIWEATARTGLFSPFIFPTISGSIMWGIENASVLLSACWRTLRLLLIAMTLSTVVSLSIGVASALSKTVGEIADAYISVFNPLPSISLLPFALLWFGLGESPILAITFFGSLWPFLLNILNGIRTVNQDQMDAARLISLSEWQAVRYVTLPLALPGIVTGLKCAWGIAWRSVVASELVFGAVGMEGGIGWIVYCNRFLLNPEGMVAAIFCISIIGVFTENILLSGLERRTIMRWGIKR